MSNRQRLFWIRTLHTLIYLVMAGSTIFILLSGLFGYVSPLLWVALVLVGIEAIVFSVNRFHCPLTSLAVKYGAEKGYVFDTFLPETATKYTFRVFASLLALGILFLLLRFITGSFPPIVQSFTGLGMGEFLSTL
jgi:hypothetical protein